MSTLNTVYKKRNCMIVKQDFKIMLFLLVIYFQKPCAGKHGVGVYFIQ